MSQNSSSASTVLILTGQQGRSDTDECDADPKVELLSTERGGSAATKTTYTRDTFALWVVSAKSLDYFGFVLKM